MLWDQQFCKWKRHHMDDNILKQQLLTSLVSCTK